MEELFAGDFYKYWGLVSKEIDYAYPLVEILRIFDVSGYWSTNLGLHT